MTTTDEELLQQLALCEAATPGPWTVRELSWAGIGLDGKAIKVFTPLVEAENLHPDLPGLAHRRGHVVPPNYGMEAENPYLRIHRDNVAFIAAARTGWPAALRLLLDAREAVRRHMNYRGDDRCLADDGELYRAVLPEGDTRPEKDTAVTLENCARYIECKQQGKEYVSPQRRIEELEAENEALRVRVEGMRMALDLIDAIRENFASSSSSSAASEAGQNQEAPQKEATGAVVVVPPPSPEKGGAD